MTYLARDPDAALEALRALVDRVGAEAIESGVNTAGYGLLQAGHVEPAREVFTLNTQLFPEASNAWDSLGEACLAAGDEEAALAHYEYSLVLDPGSETARAAVARLRGD